MTLLLQTSPALFLLTALGVNAWRDARKDRKTQ